MRRVWFTFKIFETLLGLCCMGYHSRGFLNINYIQDHYAYVAIFGGFSLMAMFGCISICLKETISAFREGCLNILAAICFIVVSMNSMYHAEKDFHLMYLSLEKSESIEGEHLEQIELTEQPHPFFKYSKAQSVAALCCGSLFLLHAVLAFDVATFEDDEIFNESDEDERYDDNRVSEHLIFYVFGKNVHEWLNQFEWFITLADAPIVRREELLHISLPDNQEQRNLQYV